MLTLVNFIDKFLYPVVYFFCLGVLTVENNDLLCKFGRKVKELRISQQMTQREFAEKVGITAASLSSYEKGQQMPSIGVAVSISTAFDVPLDWLCGLSEGISTLHDQRQVWEAFRGISNLIDMTDGELFSSFEVSKDAPATAGRLSIHSKTLFDFIRNSNKFYEMFADDEIDVSTYDELRRTLSSCASGDFSREESENRSRRAETSLAELRSALSAITKKESQD